MRDEECFRSRQRTELGRDVLEGRRGSVGQDRIGQGRGQDRVGGGGQEQGYSGRDGPISYAWAALRTTKE